RLARPADAPGGRAGLADLAGPKRPQPAAREGPAAAPGARCRPAGRPAEPVERGDRRGERPSSQRFARARRAQRPPEDARALGYRRAPPVVAVENELPRARGRGHEVTGSAGASSAPAPRLRPSWSVQDSASGRRWDLSCASSTFLPAPSVRRAIVKYLKSSRPGHEYLEADYACEPGYALASFAHGDSSSSSRLLCEERRWIGRLPVCEYREDSGPTCARLGCDQLCSIADDRPECSCREGYRLDQDRASCIDVDECATDNGGCSEMCENTEGGFFCACDGDERALSADRTSCVGEYRAVAGGAAAERRLLRTEPAAAATCCSAPSPVGRGYLKCSDSERAAAAADEEAEQRRTRPVGAGTRCHLECPRGYELRGEYELTCRSDGRWDGPKHGECLGYGKPRLDCPKDVLAELPVGRDEAFVAYEQPSTDLDWFRYVRSRPSWGTRLEANLKLGLHEVSFYARHPVSGKLASCRLKISVQEGQAPKVHDCPSDVQVTGRNGSAIFWTEPIFTDNVGVSRVTSTRRPGQTFSLGGHKVEYEAADEAGWTTKCIFTVVLRPLPE
ncbi:sushi, von Willebrand factor type A, EGF and pentraxin domain-containing protein 1, partial [Phymastichus coffea]|uniref:sushi, von Willebrand factor type A, EGF and pentraxin domain-containing protein 1 n=1 Tax=Phymastichus coffea TaxID=108790 RepID=UPI00273B38EB